MRAITKGIAFSTLLVAFSISIASGQSTKSAPKPKPKPTPKARTELTDAELTARLKATLRKPEVWKHRTFPEFNVTIDMPRDPVRQTESFYDEALGNTSMIVYSAAGDNASYIVVQARMPYSITENGVLREMYREIAKGFTEESQTQFQHVKDISVDGNFGVELRSLPSDVAYQPARARIFMSGRYIYMIFATPYETEGEDSAPSEKLQSEREIRFESFFSSLRVVKNTPIPSTVQASPVLSANWMSGNLRSDHFGFELKAPNNWLKLAEDDVDSLRNWGREVIAANSKFSVPKAQPKQNIATFLSGSLGKDDLAMLAINIGLPAKSHEEARVLAKVSAEVLSKISNYEVIKQPYETRIGDALAFGIENRIKLSGATQIQHVFYVHRRDFVLGFVVTCYLEKDCQTGIEALGTLKFDK